MGIFDKFKKNKAEEAKTKSEPAVAEDVKTDTVSEPKSAVKQQTPNVKARGALAFRILQKPVITEKTTMLSGAGKYVFHVDPQSNKSEIGKAVENTFKVHVKAVNIVKVSGKSRRYGKSLGRTKDWKKAIVTLKAGERIEGITATETA